MKEKMMRMQSSYEASPRQVLKKGVSYLALVAFWGAGLPGSSYATTAPTGGVVTSGTATISQTSNTTNINQSTNKATINWTSFSTSSDETVNFVQPSSSSITLNRVTGSDKSVLAGVLNANGNVFLINSNGVLFTKGSSVNAAGFLASTLNITDADFNAGNYVFKSTGTTGSITNLGTITAQDGGYVALLGNTVSNQGIIAATKGTVALASGNEITLNFNGDSLLSVTIDEGTLDALVENKEAIYADGGTVIMTAEAADDLLSAQVNNSGLIQARTIGDLMGDISLHAYNGTTTVTGTLDASAPDGGNGGTIETSGNTVKVADSAYITTAAASGTTGTWIIDPDGYTIAASGGDITGTKLSSELADTNISIASTDGSGSDGDIDVNDAVSWSANTTLKLTATNDININSAITASGDTAGLTLDAGNDININNAVTLSGADAAMVMNYGDDYNILTKASYSGAVTDSDGNLVADTDTSNGVYGSITLSGDDASLNINGTPYTLIHSQSDLENINSDTADSNGYSGGTGYYALAGDLDLSGTTYSTSVISFLTGTLAGLGHTINDLTITVPTTTTGKIRVGLIGMAWDGSIIRDIGLTNVNITAAASTKYSLLGAGALVGYMYDTTVSNAYSTGTINFAQGSNVGGLIGRAATDSTGSVVEDSYSSVSVTNSNSTAGGLIGSTDSGTSVLRSDATGTVTSPYDAGGLIGAADSTYIDDSYATGDVGTYGDTSTETGGSVNAGGLVGYYSGYEGYTNSIVNSFATGNVIGAYDLGGLVGYIFLDGSMTIDNDYATGDVSAGASKATIDNAVGGLIGHVYVYAETGNTITISNSHASGNVTVTGTGVRNVGGLIGELSATSNGNNSLITNSYATGDVTATDAEFVGGLAGAIIGTNVTGSYETGDVEGGSGIGGVGGLIGVIGAYSYMLNGVFYESTASVSGSYASGIVTGNTITADGSGISTVGGLVGSEGVNTTVTNSYWNSDSGYSGIGDKGESSTITGSDGIATQEFTNGDLSHYLDGTITPILSFRSAAVSQQSGTQSAISGQTSTTDQALEDQTNQLGNGSTLEQQSNVDSYIDFGGSDSYSAHIKAVEAEGTNFDLENDNSKTKTKKK
jgi:filamentous hemagglutinin family protein